MINTTKTGYGKISFATTPRFLSATFSTGTTPTETMPIRVYTIKTTSEETIIAFGSVFLGFFASEVMSIGIVEP